MISIEAPLDDELCRLTLLVFKASFEARNRTVLPRALKLCLDADMELPKWLRLGWQEAYEDASKHKSWDKALGRPGGKGKHTKNRKLHDELRHRIVCRVSELTRKRGDKKRDKKETGLFNKIADEMKADGIKISGGTVRDIYYDEGSKLLRKLAEWRKARGLNSDFLA
jgi:hypothetical protein